MNITQQPWFAPTVGIMVLLPLLTLILTELLTNLVRRSSPLVPPLRFLRNYLLPSLALYFLLTEVLQKDNEYRGVQIAASIAGLCIIMFILSALKAVIFDKNESKGSAASWRTNMPQIFIDVLRFFIIATGLAFILQTFWGVDIPGFFETLGVTAVVAGLALQSVFGGIVSGLLMQFERPFEVGDYIKVSSTAKPGLVTNISWRSTTLEMKGTTVIVPNENLAKVSIENLSKSGKPHVETFTTHFDLEDAPAEVNDLLLETVNKTEMVAPGETAKSRYLGNGSYETDVPLISHQQAKTMKSMFHSRLWYAAKRRSMTLDKGSSTFDYIDIRQELRNNTSALHLDTNDINVLTPRLNAQQFADGEIISEAGHYFEEIMLITGGQIKVEYINHLGEAFPIVILSAGDYIGQEMLSHLATPTRMVAVGTTTLVSFNQKIMDELLDQKPSLVLDIGKVSEERGRGLVEIMKEYGPKNKLISMETVLH